MKPNNAGIILAWCSAMLIVIGAILLSVGVANRPVAHLSLPQSAAANGTAAQSPEALDYRAPTKPLPEGTIAPAPVLAEEDINAGARLYAANCASCHGVNLEGQPNWKKPLADGKYPAPPHDDSGHTWHHNDSLLTAIIINGGLGNGDMSHGNMPAFKGVLTEQQAKQILIFFKSRWTQEHRDYQWARTALGN